MDKKKYIIIFERFLSNAATSEEKRLLEDFILHDSALSKWMEEKFSNSDSTIPDQVRKRILDNIRSQTCKGSAAKNDEISISSGNTPLISHVIKNNIIWRWLSYTAAILLLTGIISGYFLLYRSNSLKYTTVSADPGNKANIILPDSSRVIINSASSIQYNSDFNKDDRNLILQGEAFFDVSHNKSKPFIIILGDTKVKVLGTAFVINAYKEDEEIDIILNKGKIEFISAGKSVLLKPNDRLIYNKSTHIIAVSKINADDYLGWITNRLRFENETLEAITKKISRMHNKKFVFENKDVKQYRFSGTVDISSLHTALNMIAQTAPISYEIRDNVVRIRKNRDKTNYYEN